MSSRLSITENDFVNKVWKIAGIVTLVIVLVWLFKTTFNVFLLILAGALVALYFRGLSGLIYRKTELPLKWSLPISIVGSLVILILFFWLAGAKISEQANQLTKTLPATIEKVKAQAQQSAIGREVLKMFSSGNMQKASSTVQTFFRSTFGVLGDVYVVLFLGIFFTAAPKLYTDGFVKLMPASGRQRAREVVNEVGQTLTKWLKGQLMAMAIVAVLTAIGLIILGVPMAIVLALIAGILNFIPNFGPLIAMVPAVLVGFTQGSTTALLVAGLYILVQVIESNLITPQIQKRLIQMPPALIIIAQLFMGVLTGGWGLVLATPIVAMLIVLVRELWVKEEDAKDPQA